MMAIIRAATSLKVCDIITSAPAHYFITVRKIMARRRLLSYLRTFRKRSGLTQAELAFLVGQKSGTQFSRFERLKRIPNAETLIAIMIVFRESPQELFPALFESVAKEVRDRATTLHEEIQGDRRQTTKMKLDTLEELLNDEQNNSLVL